MSKIPVTNNGKMNIWVGGQMIPPGETRHFEPHHVPPEYRPAPATAAPAEPETPDDPLEIVRAGNVKEVTSALPALSLEDLDRLEALENASETPRKGVLSAITADRLRRAAGEGGGE